MAQLVAHHTGSVGVRGSNPLSSTRKQQFSCGFSPTRGIAVGIPCPGEDEGLRSTACYFRLVATEITQRELRNNSGEIMRQLDRGQSFIVTRNGVPVGELSPLRRDRFVGAAAAVAAFRGAPRVDLDRLRADLDAVANQDLTPRG